MRWPITVWRWMNGHLVVVERSRLRERRVGDRELADVVQLRGELELLECRVGAARAPLPTPRLSKRHAADVLAQSGSRSYSACSRTRAAGHVRSGIWYFWA